MVAEHKERAAEVHQMCRMLRSTVEKIEATQSNEFFDSREARNRLSAQFNTTLEQVIRLGGVAEGFFAALDVEAPIDEILFAYEQLASYSESADCRSTPTDSGTNTGDAPGSAPSTKVAGASPSLESLASLSEAGHGVVQAGERIQALAKRAHVTGGPDDEVCRLESDELPDAADELFIFAHMLRRLARDAHGST